LLDIERDPVEQGFELGGYDVVIAANVLHATTDIVQTMTHVGRLIAPGGLLLVAEALEWRSWVFLTFGLTEGFWRFTDQVRGHSTPLLSRDTWRHLLAERGFADIVILPDEKRAVGPAAQQALIVARRTGNTAARRWLMLAGQEKIAQRLQHAMLAAGHAVTVIEPEIWRPVMRAPDLLCRQQWWPAGEDAEPVEIVYLGALDSREGDGATSELSSTTVLTLLQATSRLESGRVWLVTRGAQDIRGPTDVTAPDQAAAWGLGRTFALEHPARWGGLLDLDPAGNAEDAAAALIEALAAGNAEDQMAWRDGVRLVARLASVPPAAAATISLKADRSYLVTGGLGALGIEIARRLVDRGARHLVLAGRTKLPPRHDWAAHAANARVAAVAALERAGAAVETPALDVGDPVTLTAMMERFGREWPPLAGVVHAAIAPTTASLAEMGPETLESMFRTKVQSARLLYSLSALQPVDFFVSFSTTTALLGSAQLAHYAAANAVLDALACLRRVEGRPALSINWGTWDQIRSVSEQDRIWIARGGLRPIPTAAGLDALESLLATGATRAIVADVDWAVLRSVYETRRAQPLLSRLTKGVTPRARQEADSRAVPPIADRLARAPAGTRRELLLEFIRDQVAAVLGLDESKPISTESGLFDMGMDSLMSVELRRRLERGVRRTLPSTLTFNYPSVSALAAFLERDIQGVSSAAPVPTAPAVSKPSDDHLDELSDAELEARLLARLEEVR
jgi:acyl carrier protein